MKNRGRFWWKCRWHLGHCSQDSASRDFFFIPSVGLTEHLCYSDFFLQGKCWNSEQDFPLQPGLSCDLPFLITIGASCTMSFEIFCKITVFLTRVTPALSHVAVVGHYLALIHLEAVRQWWVMICLPMWTMTTLTSFFQPKLFHDVTKSIARPHHLLKTGYYHPCKKHTDTHILDS